MSLTEKDKEIFALCPRGWFSSDDMSPYIKNRDDRARRLRDAGLLESKVIGTPPDLQTLYRRKIRGMTKVWKGI
jgi:hypothetical protein